MNSRKGFTLVEIMFAVAIIGLLASIGIPAVLNALETARQKTREAHITSIEKAKSMLTLPELVYAYGRSLEEGTEFGEGEYTEENLMACIKNVQTLKDMKVGDNYLIPGSIGTKAHFTKTRPAYADKD
jgi:prepilin-type N-terminal cleavage/methylation domain-containing protein